MNRHHQQARPTSMDGDAGGRVAASTGARSPPDPADSAAAAAAAETTGDDPRTPLPVAGADSPPAAATFDDDTIRSRRRVTLPLFSVRLSKSQKSIDEFCRITVCLMSTFCMCIRVSLKGSRLIL